MPFGCGSALLLEFKEGISLAAADAARLVEESEVALASLGLNTQRSSN